MMAPVFGFATAGRSVWSSVIVLLAHLLVPDVSAAWVYDRRRHTLLGIRSSMEDFFGTIPWNGVFQPLFSRSLVPPPCQP